VGVNDMRETEILQERVNAIQERFLGMGLRTPKQRQKLNKKFASAKQKIETSSEMQNANKEQGGLVSKIRAAGNGISKHFKVNKANKLAGKIKRDSIAREQKDKLNAIKQKYAKAKPAKPAKVKNNKRDFYKNVLDMKNMSLS